MDSIIAFNPSINSWVSAGNLPEIKQGSDARILGDKVYIVAGATGESTPSNKVFAADLNASVEGVHDLYVKTGDASTGIPTVQAEVADGSIGPSKLSSEISNALKPVVVGQPNSVVSANGGSAYLTVGATGGDNTYQWKKDGADIAGATSRTLSITDLNASQHVGNYTVVVSNAFGSVNSSVAQIDVNGSLTEGLVGWWKFDEGSGTVAYDSSGNGNDGNLMGGPSWTSGKIGGALSFDGVNKYVDVGNSSMLNPSESMSITCWFLPSEISDYVYGTPLVTRYVAGTDFSRKSYYLNFSSLGEPQYYLYNGSSTTASAKSQIVLLSDQYCFIAVAYSTLGGSMYLNNVKVAELELGELTSIMQSSVSTRIGGWGHNDWPEFKGIIDEVRIYDRALSAVEVKALYELGEQPVQESGSGTTTVVNGTVADGSITASKIADQTITTNQLSEQILKYLKPEITQQPTAGTIFAYTNGSISVSAEGKYLTYQWKKNGVNLAGETSATLKITDANATQHDGNYSVVVSNDFGSVESEEFELQISDALMNGLVGWWKFDETDGTIAYDSSGNGNDGNLTNGPTWVTGKIGGALSFDGNDDRLKLPHQMMNGLSEFSISFWFKENERKEQMFLSLATESDFNRFIFYLSINITNFVISDKSPSEGVLNYQCNANFEQWNAISLVRTSSDAKIFLSDRYCIK